MAITLLTSPSTPNPTAIGDWALMYAQLTACKQLLKGNFQVLTELDTTTVPEIALGTYLQHLGAIYIVDTANFPIAAGALAVGINYVRLTTSGVTLTVDWVVDISGYSWDYQNNGMYNGASQILPYSVVYAATPTYKKYNYSFGNAKPLPTEITVTVGAAGDFTTINLAIEHLTNNFYPVFPEGKAIINLLAGFVMAEQVLIEGLDLSWIEITGVDASTTITRSALTVSFGSGYPAFGGINNAVLPIIDQLFAMDATGAASTQNGISLGYGSKGVVKSNKGVTGCANYGVHAFRGSHAVIYSTNFSGAGVIGLYADTASVIEARFSDISGCTADAVKADEGSLIDVSQGDLSVAGSNAINCINTSVVNASNTDLKNCGAQAVIVQTMSRVNVNAADSTGSSTGIVQTGGSITYATGFTGAINIAVNTLFVNGICFQ